MVLKKILSRFRALIVGEIISTIKQIHDLQLISHWEKLKKEASNPLNRAGEKYFSQNEEDGITLEILKRIGLEEGVFAEFGVGNGTENNTLVLLASGWRGFWVGGESLVINHRLAPSRFSFIKRWIDRENILSVLQKGMDTINAKAVDVLSLDMDGNDIYLVEELLKKKIHPKLFIVEYNAKFPPTINWRIEYDKNHIWGNDDYFGASLSSFNEVFHKYGYILICCNFTGANAFFIKKDLIHFFNDVPRGVENLFYKSAYYLFQSFGHKSSAKTIEKILKLDNPEK